MNGKTTLRLVVDVELSAPAAYRLRKALAGENARLWLRNVLEGAIEQLLAWICADNCFRARVVSGRVTELRDPEHVDVTG